jgi:hypothetical protein
MSDDEADPELLALLRQSLGLNIIKEGISDDTGGYIPEKSTDKSTNSGQVFYETRSTSTTMPSMSR